MNSKKNFWRHFAGKGYYIALILCAVAIGISGYLYYRNASNTPSDDPAVNAGVQNDPNVQAMATQPTGGTSGNIRTPIKTGLPLSGETVASYAMDCLSYNPTTRDWRVHNGVDIAAEAGTPVCAAADGVVYTTYEDEAMGTTVVIRHDGGYVTMYASLDADVTVSAGDTVELGQTIGYVGSSALLESAIGDHVHFCVTVDDESMDPADFFAMS
jgi:murein DD-endopeptidase MepM/ murein hydrolase activator NlpD